MIDYRALILYVHIFRLSCSIMQIYRTVRLQLWNIYKGSLELAVCCRFESITIRFDVPKSAIAKILDPEHARQTSEKP
jgi:hypothetical protein